MSSIVGKENPTEIQKWNNEIHSKKRKSYSIIVSKDNTSEHSCLA